MKLDDFEACLVDLDGTLYRAGWLKIAMSAELLLCGLRWVPVIRAFRQEHERIRQQLKESVADPYQLQIARTAERCGLEEDLVRRVTDRWMIHRPGKWLRLFRRSSLLKEIVNFRQRGGKTALVSDYPAEEKLKSLRATELFDLVVANGEDGGSGRLKPWPDGYLLAAERLRVAPAKCCVLGDRRDADGEAARRAGMEFRLIR